MLDAGGLDARLGLIDAGFDLDGGGSLRQYSSSQCAMRREVGVLIAESVEIRLTA